MQKVAEFYKRLPLLSFLILRRPFQKSQSRDGYSLTALYQNLEITNRGRRVIIQYKIEDENRIQMIEILPPYIESSLLCCFE